MTVPTNGFADSPAIVYLLFQLIVCDLLPYLFIDSFLGICLFQLISQEVLIALYFDEEYLAVLMSKGINGFQLGMDVLVFAIGSLDRIEVYDCSLGWMTAKVTRVDTWYFGLCVMQYADDGVILLGIGLNQRIE